MFSPAELQNIRSDFEIFKKQPGIIYLDSAATSLTPAPVVNRIGDYYEQWNANVHRGAYRMSEKATDLYERVRTQIAHFIGLPKGSDAQVIYTRGTTESLNMVAQSWARDRISTEQSVLVTRMEHHSNFVPWQQMAAQKGARFQIVELTPDQELDEDLLQKHLNENVAVFAFSAMSNALGTINPVSRISTLAKEKGVPVVLDAAQSMAHKGCVGSDLEAVDFLAFSAHKMCGPTGVGVLVGKKDRLEEMNPWMYGGDMILDVQDQRTTWNELPWRLEAGTPNIADVIGFGAAIEYLNSIGMDRIQSHEKGLLEVAFSELERIEGVRTFGPKQLSHRGATISFVLDQVHPHDLATFLDSRNICIRAGHHCAQPLMRSLGVSGTARASFYFYNTLQDVEALVSAVKEAKEYFNRS